MRRRLPHSGTERTRCRFLLFPMEIGNERRWLEKARWTEKCYKNALFPSIRHWAPVRWLDEEKPRNMVQVHPGRADEDRAVAAAIERLDKARRGK